MKAPNKLEYPDIPSEDFVLPDGQLLPPKPFPYDIWPTIYFYRYRGSLTIPPCTSMVNWRVFDEPLQISRRQMKKLANLINNYRDPETCKFATYASSVGETARPLQKFDYVDASIAHCTPENYAGLQGKSNK